MSRRNERYKCVAPTIEAFVRQLAVQYVSRGYRFYVTGVIPESKDARLVDAGIVERYGLALSKYQRCRRKAAGLANVQYLRHGRFFVLVATEGEHAFLRNERPCVLDCHAHPIKFASYAISYRPSGSPKVSVRIERETFSDIRAFFLEMATRRSALWLERQIWGLPFEPYGPIQKQLTALLRAVNEKRKRAEGIRAGLEPLRATCVRRRLDTAILRLEISPDAREDAA